MILNHIIHHRGQPLGLPAHEPDTGAVDLRAVWRRRRHVASRSTETFASAGQAKRRALISATKRGGFKNRPYGASHLASRSRLRNSMDRPHVPMGFSGSADAQPKPPAIHKCLIVNSLVPYKSRRLVIRVTDNDSREDQLDLDEVVEWWGLSGRSDRNKRRVSSLARLISAPMEVGGARRRCEEEVTLVKPIRFISAGVLLLFLGTLTPLFAQHDQHGQETCRPRSRSTRLSPKDSSNTASSKNRIRGSSNRRAKKSSGNNNSRPEDSRTSSISALSSNSRARKDSGNNSSKPLHTRTSSTNAPSSKPGDSRTRAPGNSSSISARRSYDPRRNGSVTGSSNSGPPGSSIAPATGTPNAALGSSVAATMAIAFPTTITAPATAEITGSTSGASPLWL